MTAPLRRLSQRLAVSIAVGLVTGIVAGFGSAAFLHGLTWATSTRIAHGWLLWLLPVAGLGIGFLRRLAGRATGGTNLLLDEFHENDASTPTRPAPVHATSVICTAAPSRPPDPPNRCVTKEPT